MSSRCLDSAKKLRSMLKQGDSVIDIGSGSGEYANFFKYSGLDVKTLDINPENKPDYLTGLVDHNIFDKFDAAWCAHTLEHIQDVNEALWDIKTLVKDDGYICITVPPLKHNLVGGHVNLWNEGLLLYNMILAGIDCRDAIVGVYGYNITVIARNAHIKLPDLYHDKGDIELLSGYFPIQVRHKIKHGVDGRLGSIGW